MPQNLVISRRCHCLLEVYQSQDLKCFTIHTLRPQNTQYVSSTRGTDAGSARLATTKRPKGTQKVAPNIDMEFRHVMNMTTI